MELSEHLKSIASKGGKARWKGISKEERSKIMSKIRKGKKKKL